MMKKMKRKRFSYFVFRLRCLCCCCLPIDFCGCTPKTRFSAAKNNEHFSDVDFGVSPSNERTNEKKNTNLMFAVKQFKFRQKIYFKDDNI
jgi:hypothetical protein